MTLVLIQLVVEFYEYCIDLSKHFKYFYDICNQLLSISDNELIAWSFVTCY